MKRLLIAIVVLGLAAPLARAVTPLYVSADVPTTETATLTTLLPNQIHRVLAAPSYTLTLTIPGSPTLDGIHKMDKPKNWLFSVESANNLGGALGGADADPRDVIRFDGSSGTYSFFFCGATVGIPAGVNVDAVDLLGGDTGSLEVSFDVPTTIGAFQFDPADVVIYRRTGAGCGGWTLPAGNPVFDASAAGTGVATSANVIGIDHAAACRLLTFDVPVDLGPPAATYLPGQVVCWNGATFSLWESLAGWPISGLVDGLARPGNPGLVPATLVLSKTAAPQLDTSDVILTWTPSCSEGGIDYGIYEGSIGTWYSHTQKDCSDGGVSLTEQITPASGPRYYLVVPHNGVEEGSYGVRSSLAERPVGAAPCMPTQLITPCPP